MHPSRQILGSEKRLNLLTLPLAAVDQQEMQGLCLSNYDLKRCPVESRLERYVRDLTLHLEFALPLVSVVEELLREALLQAINSLVKEAGYSLKRL